MAPCSSFQDASRDVITPPASLHIVQMYLWGTEVVVMSRHMKRTRGWLETGTAGDQSAANVSQNRQGEPTPTCTSIVFLK